MNDQRNQGHGGPPDPGRQNSGQQRGAQDNPPDQGGQNGSGQQGAQGSAPQQGGRGPNTRRITPERRIREWRQGLHVPPPVNRVGRGLVNPGRGMGADPYAYANLVARKGESSQPSKDYIIGRTQETDVIQGNGRPPNFPPTMLHGNRPPNFPPTMIHGNQPPNYMNTAIPPAGFVTDPRSFAPLYQPFLRQWGSNGPEVPSFPPFQQAMPPMPTGNPRNWQGAGAASNQGRIVQAPGSSQPRNPATSNAAARAPANIQRPAGGQPSQETPANGQPTGKQTAAKRPAGKEPADEQPAQKRPAGEVHGAAARGGAAGGERPAGDQPANNNTGAAVPTNPASLSVAERLTRGLITDVEGLNRQEQDELLLWARERRKKWKDIHRDYKFKVKEVTLRGRHRILRKNKPPREPKFTERDIELLLEAVEHLAGGHLDNVDNTKIKRLWTRVQEYIEEHGGETTAGPMKLKKKYKALRENMPEVRRDLKPRKAKRGQKADGNSKDQSRVESPFDDDGKEKTPTGKSGTQGGGTNGKKKNRLEWDDSEYEPLTKRELRKALGKDYSHQQENENEDNEDNENADNKNADNKDDDNEYDGMD